MRLLLGIVGGAIFGAIVAAAAIGAIFGLLLVFLEGDAAIDLAHDLKNLPGQQIFAACCGALLGGLAGFASKWSQSGLPFLWCCAIIGVGAGVTRLFTESHTKSFNIIPFSYIATLGVALLIAIALALAGRMTDSESRRIAE